MYRTNCPLIFYAMVIAFWLGVTNAWLNLVKASVKTRMFSLPSFKGSTLVKSIHTRSIGLLGMMTPGIVFGLV